MIDLKSLEVWFVTGSQHLYGDEVLKQVAADSQAIVQGSRQHAGMPMRIVFKPVMTGPDAIRDICREANGAANCVGLVAWMHTFSPAKMWIGGLQRAQQAVRAPAHAVQSRHSVVDDRHEFHEPQPVGPRRPRVRVHLQPDATGADGGRRPLAG